MAQTEAKPKGKGKGKAPPCPSAAAVEAAALKAEETRVANMEKARLAREATREVNKHVCLPVADPDDPYDLRSRFCTTQQIWFEQALKEIQAGNKESCWSWYIFVAPPHVGESGLEEGSSTSQRYALRDAPGSLHGGEAARAFLKFKEVDGVNLRQNYIRMMTSIAKQLEAGIKPARLVGCLDVPKLRASLQLLQSAARDESDDEMVSVCSRVLRQFDEQDA
mmetsp:Transcript_81630/g.134893  ORF Transcript_81630/g.134893 Transcript_81630/m.134893 type:complete len:222 (-) Transcript_81630:147-812(-)